MSLLEKIDQMTERLYQRKINEGYAMLTNNMSEIGTAVAKEVENIGNQKADINRILDAMNMASDAIRVNDSILIADLFHYEIRPELEKLEK